MVRRLLGLLLPGLPMVAATISGRVLDTSGAAVPSAEVTIVHQATGVVFVTRTDREGAFALDGVGGGAYALSVRRDGFAESVATVRVAARATVEVRLHPATVAQEIIVRGNALVSSSEQLRQLPGAVDILDTATLTQARVFTTDEVLRKVPGVHTRPEEGFGLRPNIGIRGLNPTRSSKVLLLEDGLPLAYAPYGDNASYYHPPVDRFEQIEVVKGAGQILYGPSTVGGVINYLTPAPPAQRGGFVTLTGGARDYVNGHLRYGATIGATGFLLDYARKQGDGARENTHFGLHDLNGKVLTSLSSRQTLTLKANYYGEDSNLTYSGLRQDEFLANPRANPFRNDFFFGDHTALAGTHAFAATPNLVLTSSVYAATFFRDWWRQSSNSAQRPNDAGDPACGGMANLYTTCGNEGRLRKYYTGGLESKARMHSTWLGVPNELDVGFRAHFESQDRRQENGDTPTSRSGVLVESNERRNQAYSAFMQHRLGNHRLTITPGLRVEHVRYERTNRLNGARGRTDLTALIPGIGIVYSPTSALSLFTGVHRGFAPPRTEDIINNATGGTIDLDPEQSWNYEAGLRARWSRAMLEATCFRLSFTNQIIPASIAGGIGAVLTSAGRTGHSGLELSGRFDQRNLFGSRHHVQLRGAFTYLPVAEFAGNRFSTITAGLRVTGNRLPYAPKHLLTASVTYWHASGANMIIESVYTGRQFTDDLNTANPSPNGQRGLIPPSTIWNVTLNYPIEAARATLFLSTKNLFDRLYIVDRSRGILPGMPRLIHAGVRFTF